LNHFTIPVAIKKHLLCYCKNGQRWCTVHNRYSLDLL
jgi:hypothetical protein